MNYLLLYFLVGAIVAVFTVINNQNRETPTPDGRELRPTTRLAAIVFIALAWPLSVVVFVYAILSSLTGRAGHQEGR